MCSCAVPRNASQRNNISESTDDVSSVLFDDSEHGIIQAFCLLNLHYTSADDGFSGMSSVSTTIAFNNPTISADHSDLLQCHGFPENSPPDLLVWWFYGSIVILAVLLIWEMQDSHSRISSISCFTGLRQCCCLASFYNYKRKCQYLQSVRHQWSSQILSVLCLCVLLFQPMADGTMAEPSPEANAAATAHSTAHHIEMSHLASTTDFSDPRQLKELFGAVVSGFQTQLYQLTKDKEALEHQLTKDKEVWMNKTQLIEKTLMKQNQYMIVLQEENRALRLELDRQKKRVTSLESTVAQLSNKTTTDTRFLKAEVENISIRLDQCELDSFEQMINRRRNQEQSSACGIDAVQSMLAVCCSSGLAGNGHRLLQADGCDSLPPTCSLQCSSQFISIFQNCQGHPVLEQLPPGQLAQWTGFLGQCQEVQQSAAELSVADAQPAMIFHCLVLDDAVQSQAEMFGQVSSPVLPVGPLQPIVTPPSPPQASDGGVAHVQEFRRVCTRANLTVCAPPCNQASDGFLLSILIGGRGTMMTCNQEDGIFSWQGQSALGSCITRRAQTWLENIITHAAGTFALELAVSVAVLTAADLVAGQSAMLHGAAGGLPPVWTYSGEGSAFIVGAGAELEISAVTVAATSGLAFRIADSSTIMVTSLQLQKGDGSSDAISCAALATGVGQAGLTCADTGFGSVNVAGPLFISTSGTGFGMGATKYMGDDRGVFEEAVSTREPGLYTCQISHDEIVTLTLPVESAMHVSIVGDDSMPQWSFAGEGLTFTVAVHAYLNLAYVTVPGSQISLMRGGEVSLDHVQMQGAQIHVAGSLAATNSQLTDVQFETEAPAVMTIDSTSISGTRDEALALAIGCSVAINNGEIRNAELQVTSDGELVVTDTAIYVEGMAVSVQTGGSFTISTSQLIHGEITDPFPCNGANMACTGPHAGSVIVSGPASINTAAPLVCADESAGSCLSGYVDMPSCLADIARGMDSCFVYLQRDTGELGTISVNAGEHFEIHGNQGEPKLRILADFDVSGALLLADLQIVGGSGDGSQMSVEASGELTFERVQMEGGSLTFAGVISLMESSLVQVVATGSSGSALSLSGGTLTGSTFGVTSGRMTVDVGCVLTDSPLNVGGAGSSVTVTGAELQSDGSSVPLTIESGGMATVSGTTFRSTAGDITVVSVAEGGSLTVGGSQLVGADESANPFPCDGTLPDCAGQHDGPVVVEGRAAVNMAAPLVCDVETGECLSMPVHLITAGVTSEQFAVGVTTGVDLSADAVCFTADYLTVPDDPGFLVTAGQGFSSDPGYVNYDSSMPSDRRSDSAEFGGVFGLGASTVTWYRLPASKSLATSPPGGMHCGTDKTGWLTGWPAAKGQPSYSDRYYSAPADGSLPPPTGDPPSSGYVCFDNNVPTSVEATCYQGMSVRIRAVSCGDFMLWELPPQHDLDAAYCLDDACASCSPSGQCTDTTWSESNGCMCSIGWSGKLCNEWTQSPVRGMTLAQYDRLYSTRTTDLLNPNTNIFLQAQSEISGRTWVKCFDSAMDDASTPAVFHIQCDPYDKTVSIAVNSLGHTFGGYVSILLTLLFSCPSVHA
eukprot:SAG31_NODE_223_length_19859_cov_14.949899_9_plen_1578_part_00